MIRSICERTIAADSQIKFEAYKSANLGQKNNYAFIAINKNKILCAVV